MFFLSLCYWLWVYRSSSEGAYVVTAINHEWSASYDGISDLNREHELKLTYNFSSIGVMIFWFPCYHPYSLNKLRYTIGFDYLYWWAKSYFWPIRNVPSWSRLPRCKIRVDDILLVTEYEMCNHPFVSMFCSRKGCGQLWIWFILFFWWF